MRFVVGLLLGLVVAMSTPSGAVDTRPQYTENQRINALCRVVKLEHKAPAASLFIACPRRFTTPLGT